MTAAIITVILPLVSWFAVANPICDSNICSYYFLLWNVRAVVCRATLRGGSYITLPGGGRVMGDMSQLGMEGRGTRVEEIGFILQLISPDNREHHVSARSGIYRSRRSPADRVAHLGAIKTENTRKPGRQCDVAVLLTAASCSREMEADADVRDVLVLSLLLFSRFPVGLNSARPIFLSVAFFGGRHQSAVVVELRNVTP